MLSYPDVGPWVNRGGIAMRVTRLRHLSLLVYGILTRRSACLSRSVRAWPTGPARPIHRLKRLSASSPIPPCRSNRSSVSWRL